MEWDTFSEAADEAGISRLYGGIHFTDGDVNGGILGEQVAQAVWDKTQFFINGGNVGTSGNDVITGNAAQSVQIDVTDTRTAGACAAGATIVRVFTATDNCGNTATASQVITVRDLVAPTLSQVPADVTVACSAVLPKGAPTASDNCDSKPALALVETRRAGACPDAYQLVRTWTATDACGNSATASQVVTVTDAVAPTFGTLPQNVTIACDGTIPSAKPTATDDCGTDVNVAVTQTRRPGSCANTYELIRLFTATDNCGNATTATQVVTVEDTEKPVFANVPAAVALPCTATLPQDRPTATDNCDGQVEVVETERRRAGDCPGNYEIVRLFTATDKCGNTATASQVVTFGDADAPVFSYVPTNLKLSCADAIPTEQPTVTDICDAKVVVVENQERRKQTCPGTYELVRTWTATDNCGNTATASQVVTVEDRVAPTFAAVPPNASISCDDALPTSAPTATDDCDAKPTVELTETRRPGACDDTYSVIRLWTATDACGNTATARQVVTVRDDAAPTFSNVPAAVTVACSASLPTSQPSATDNCDQAVAIAETSRKEPGACADSYRLVRIWTATDNCGNTATASQVVTVEDRRAPVFADVPPAATVACDATLPTATPSVTDDCDQDVAINESQTRREGSCPDSYELVRLWTATDNCGNVATASQIVTVIDRKAPSFAVVPAAVIISCEESLPTDQPEASDACDQSVTVTEVSTQSAGGCPNSYTVTRIWTATDNCGNTATASQVVTVVDRRAPVFANVPQAVTLSCEQALPSSQPTLSDNCDRASKLTESQTRTAGACPGSYTITRLWTATDACGNTSTASQAVTFEDKRAPTFSEVPAAVTLSCEDAVPSVLAKASDNCDTDVAVSVTEVERPGECSGGFTVVRTFTATDDCGNTATASQVVTFQDRKAPVFAGVPAAVKISCDEALPTAGPTATDNCDPEVRIAALDRREPGACEDSYRIVRVWTATDACGNTATASQAIDVEDTQAPVFATVPAETTIECSADLPTEHATATDNCDQRVEVTVANTRLNGDCQDGYVIVRTFTAIDNCGNTATATQRVNVRDRTAPTFTTVPLAVTIACDASLPIKMAVATDNCDQQVTVTEAQTRIDGECPQAYRVVRTFTATDNCGNTATISQVVTVEDTEAPVFASVPAAIAIACDAPLPTDAPVATDNCDQQVTVTETQREEPGTCAGTYAVIRIWTATDACDNTATVTQRVRRTDEQAPSFANVPSDVTIACGATPPTALPTATDNCDPAPEITETSTTEPGDCPGDSRIVRVFTATDACGNSATARQVITIEDRRAPVLASVPAAVTIACDAALPTDQPTATDACDEDVTITETRDFLRSACEGNYRVRRIWTATDDCGNTATAEQLVTVQDLVAPVLASVPADATVACDATLPTDLPVATDNCDQRVQISETQTRLPGACADSYTLVRLFTATDACGNVATASQRVTVTDQLSPKLANVPQRVVVSCDEELPSDEPTATDDCDDDVTLTEARETIAGTCKGSYVLIRTWTATDNCGNTATASQRVEVGDRSEPAFTSVPEAVTIRCDDSLPTDQASAVDNCDGNVAVVETSTTETGKCADSYRVIRTWTATDGCGNVARASQVVTVEDKVAPVFASVPPAVTISCDQEVPTTQPRATDNCDQDVEIAERSTRRRGACEDGYTLTRIWTATDNCGNTATASQVITVEDRQAPTFASVPPSATIKCGEALPDGQATATDNCDTQVKVTDSQTRESGPCADSYSIVRTWTATDNCGNTATASQVITVIDDAAPMLANVPPAASVSCSAGLPTSKPTATDGCDNRVDIAETTETLQGACPDSYVVIRTWTATDNCGNTASASQTVTVSDDSPPRFTKVPTSRTVDCDEDPGDEDPVATDDCDKDVALTMTETTSGADCAAGITLTRIWTATDNCGNTATASQTIRFEDTEPPVFGKLARTLTVECDQPIAEIYPEVSDKCDRDVAVAFFDQREEKPCGAIVTRTWVATDDCGNTASATQLVIIKDSELPILAGVPAATQISCGGELPVANVTATDNCTPSIPVAYDQIVTPGRCAGESIIIRIWTATDACGNAAVGTQEVVITDGSSPSFSDVPQAVSLACGAALPTTKPTATDDCGATPPTVTVADETEPGACASSYRVIRVFTATDKCGNATTASQVITFRDDTAPVFARVPQAQNLNCGQALPTEAPTASDDCDNAPSVSVSEETISGNCANRYQVIRTWTASDACGNTATASQILTVTDEEAPVFSGVPQNVALGCNEAIPADEPTATDNCDTDVEIFMAETRADLTDGYTLTRVWTASDACGNTATASQLITVTAEGRPTFTFVPEDLELSCNATVPSAEALASDACGGTVEVSVTEKRKDGKCPGSYTLTRTWTARSSSGKTERATQTITVADAEPPVFTEVPTDRQLKCGEALPTGTPEATDACGGRVRVSVDEQRQSGGCSANRSVTRTFTATDDCGNAVVATQVLTYVDDEAPVFSYVPTSEEFQCSVGQPKDRARATDNCTKNVEVTFADVSPSTDCSQRLQRIWTATDECGNTTTAVQQILLEDTERPTLVNVPSNVSVDLSKGGSVPEPARVSATDNCDKSPSVELNQQTVPGTGCNYVIVRTWEVLDRCGNSARGTQRISVIGESSASIRVTPSDDCAPSSYAIQSVTRPQGATYAWKASGGSFEDASAPETRFVPAGAGDYTIELTVGGVNCAGTATATISVGNNSLQVTGNGPLCEGTDIVLTASSGARSYRWTGPNGFKSNTQNPVITNATAAMSGTYALVAEYGDCRQNTSVEVVVGKDLTVELEVPERICGGEPFALSVGGATTAVWTAPNGTTYAGPQVTVPAGDFATHRGTWSVQASNAAGCQTTERFDVTVVRPPVTTGSSNSPVCAEGEIVLTGSGARTYKWTGPNGFTANGERVVIDDLTAYPPGTYTFFVKGTNTNDCSSRDTIAVIVGASVDFTTDVPTTLCPGETLVLRATGGESYLWVGPNGFSSTSAVAEVTDFDATKIGEYTVVASTASGCQFQRSFNVAIGDDCGGGDCVLPEQASVSVDAAACGSATGSITIPVSDASLYTWTWLPAVSETNAAAALAAGDYSVTVIERANPSCTRFYRLTVGSEGNFTFTTQTTEASCEATGGITIAPAPAGIYTVKWADRDEPTSSLERTQLAGGSYAFELIDESGCVISGEATVGSTCACTAAPSVIRADQQSVCLTSDSRVGVVAVTAAVVPDGYLERYVLVDVATNAILAVDTERQFPVSAVGNYSIHQLISPPEAIPAKYLTVGARLGVLAKYIEDQGASLCAGFTSFGARIAVTNCCEQPVLHCVSTVEADCRTDDGIAIVQVTNPREGDLFRWTPAAGRPGNATGSIRKGLPAGDYTVEVRRAGDTTCRASIEVNIGTSTIALGQPFIEGATCGAADGTVAFPGATNAYDFRWSDGGSGATRSDLLAGRYTVIVGIAGQLCEETVSVVVPAAPDFELFAEIIQLPGCGASNGRVRIATTGGSGDFAFDWGSSDTRDNLSAGAQIVRVTDRTTGCVDSISFVLAEELAGRATVEADDVALNCFSESDGTVRYDITYDDGFKDAPQISIVDAQNQPVKQGQLGPGQYCVIVRDADGCLAGSDCFEVTAPAALAVDVTRTPMTCATGGSLALLVSGGRAPYSYDWRHLPAANDPATVGQLEAGTYAVSVTDANGCAVTLADLTVADSCTVAPQHPTTTTDTLRLTVPQTQTRTMCFDLEPRFSAASTKYRIFGSASQGISAFGRWTLATDGCLSYTATGSPGTGVDTIRVRANDPPLVDTTVYIVDVVLSGTSTVSDFNTVIERVVRQGFAGEDCFATLGLQLVGPVISVSDLCADVQRPGRADFTFDAASQCFTYLGLLPGRDTLCLQVCTATGCDTLGLLVDVLAPTPQTIGRQLLVGQSDSFCLGVSELSNPITELFNFCEAESGRAVEFSLDEATRCVTWTGLTTGSERACYVVCNAFNCDTTFIDVQVNPVGAERPPVAVDDQNVTTVNTAVTTNVLANDTLNGPLDFFMLLDLTTNGTLFIESEGVIRYTPNRGFCGRVDSFTYRITNGFEFDTATVRIDVTCDELVIFSGFSPNGDGINDEFSILGIEEFPDNNLIIFNRWGNRVFEQKDYDNTREKAFDGRWNGNLLPDGTYFYVLDLGAEEVLSGYIQIAR